MPLPTVLSVALLREAALVYLSAAGALVQVRQHLPSPCANQPPANRKTNKTATMSQQNPHPAKRQARMNAARLTVARAERRERRRRWLTAGIGVGVLAAIAVTIGVVIGVNSDGQPSTAAQIPSAPPVTAEGRTSNPPWPAPADVAGRVQAAGLPMLGEEGAVEHIHAHLDVLAGGRRVAVPENIGADEANQKISPLHTHDTTGVIHIESPVQASFSLGQVFTEWQVSLAADHLGGLRVGDAICYRPTSTARRTPATPRRSSWPPPTRSHWCTAPPHSRPTHLRPTGSPKASDPRSGRHTPRASRPDPAANHRRPT